MKDTKDVVACVVDFGMFMPVAYALSKHFKKVYYSTPTEKGFTELADFCLGHGLESITRLNEYEHPDVFDEIDLFVFPYILYGGKQLLYEKMGKAVWGARMGYELEQRKGLFYDTLEEAGLEVPPHEEIVGLTNLRLYLMEHGDCYVKISNYRGVMDTWKHRNYQLSLTYLDLMAVKLGPFQDKIRFYVLEEIETDIEGGIDAYIIDGQLPSEGVLGYEKKNESYLATVKPMKKMPEEFLSVSQAYSPILKPYRYRQFFSTEVRVKDDISYFIDPTCRTASPAGEEMLDLFTNLGDIVWYGAQGQMINPVIKDRFAGEVYMNWKGEKNAWRCLQVEEEQLDHVKLYGSARVDGSFWWPPDPEGQEETIGCIVHTGDSPTEVIERIKETAESLEGQPVSVNIASFADLIKEIESAEEQGIDFSNKPLPEAQELLT